MLVWKIRFHLVTFFSIIYYLVCLLLFLVVPDVDLVDGRLSHTTMIERAAFSFDIDIAIAIVFKHALKSLYLPNSYMMSFLML